MDPQELRAAFQEVELGIKRDADRVWDSLSEDDKLYAFCKVVSLIHRGEVEERGSYRYVLYQVFGFDMGSYMPAQLSGYLDLHNLLYDGINSDARIKRFAEFAKCDEYVEDFFKNEYKML